MASGRKAGVFIARVNPRKIRSGNLCPSVVDCHETDLGRVVVHDGFYLVKVGWARAERGWDLGWMGGKTLVVHARQARN